VTSRSLFVRDNISQLRISEYKSVTQNSRSLKGRIRRKTIRELVTDYAAYKFEYILLLILQTVCKMTTLILLNKILNIRVCTVHQ